MDPKTQAIDKIRFCIKRADHQIPVHAWGDHEAASDMARRLNTIEGELTAALSALSSAEGERWISVQWFPTPNDKMYDRTMFVMESNHPRFVKGSRFDYGFMGIATMEGYSIKVLPLPPSPNTTNSHGEQG